MGEPPVPDPISETEHIELSHRDHVISFEFSVLHFASPEKNQLAYMLEGFDTEWNMVGTRNHATYTNLPPGEYTFRVRGSNNDGVWNDEGASVVISVTPPIYRKAWFIGGVVFFVLGSVYGLHRYRMRLLSVKNRVLERSVTERTEDLTRANRHLQQEIAVRQRIDPIADARAVHAEIVKRGARRNAVEVVPAGEGSEIWRDRVDAEQIFQQDAFIAGRVRAHQPEVKRLDVVSGAVERRKTRARIGSGGRVSDRLKAQVGGGLALQARHPA